LSEYEKKEFVEFNRIVELARKARKKTIVALDKKDFNKAREEFKIYCKFHDEKDVVLNDLIKFNETEAGIVKDKSKRDIVLMVYSLSIIVLLSLFLAIAIGFWISKQISGSISAVVKNIAEVAKGNLTVDEIKITSKDETGVLANSLNSMVKDLKNLIIKVSLTSDEIAQSTVEMNTIIDETAQGSQQVAISVNELAGGTGQVSRNIEDGAANINSMNTVIQGIAVESKTIADLGNKTETNANQGSGYVQKAVEKIDCIKTVSGDISLTISKLGKLSSEIGIIADLIKAIAGQTNLLALNAAIEAARAGEYGKGFAVVAEEVKKLADQSSVATDKITMMIKEIQSKTSEAVKKMDTATNEVEEGVLVVNEAGKALENIISQVKLANIKIQQITNEIDGAAESSEEIVKMIESIAAVTEQTAASTEEISSITQEQTASLEEINASSAAIANIAKELKNQVEVFKV
jgi:methyl-accepting chemotaxis protein